MQLQTNLRHTRSDHVPNLPGLQLAGAVDHRVIAVPFESDRRVLPGQPYIERVMQKQVRE